jgi:hypothetical protein
MSQCHIEDMETGDTEMAHKVHLLGTVQGTPVCATSGFNAKTGKTHLNRRMTYRAMSATVVSPEEFRATPAKNRCAHCCDRFTPVMNARRAAVGKPLYADAMTKRLVVE